MGLVFHGYMFILLCMTLTQHSGITYLWSIRGGGITLPWVYVHSAIYENYVVEWCFIDLWSSRGGGVWLVCHGYMCILLYMKLIQCSGVA